MSESKNKFKKQDENFNSISEQENKLFLDTPATVKDFFYYGYCPRCGKSVRGPEELFCSRCGQALLWPSFSSSKKKFLSHYSEEKTGKPDLTEEAEGKDGQGSDQQNNDGPFKDNE